MLKKLILIFNLVPTCFFGSEMASYDLLDKEIEDMSFYMGYLIGRDHFRNTYGVPYHFDKMIEGMRAAEKGESIPQKEELEVLIKRIQQEIVERQSRLNLEEAKAYLQKVAKESDTITLEPLKLLYQVKKQGDGPKINQHPRLHFKVYELENGECKLKYSTYEGLGNPMQIDLEETVPGFERGVQKMRAGEERRIYVHPDLAFGYGKQDIAPNRLIIFDVQIPKED